MHEALNRLVLGQTLSAEQAERVFERILSGGADPAQIGALLALIQCRGVSADELIGAARAMRRRVEPTPTDRLPADARLVDTCGTGGSAKTFNISTAAAIVAAAAGRDAGVRVAKHGNRSRSGRGSAEALAKLGVNIDATPTTQGRCLEEAGVCFCFAIHHHPAMKHAAGPRKSLGFPTIFNLLGPLTNPAGADRQLIGVYAPELVDLVACALAELGAVRAMVVHGADGMDEVTTTDATFVGHVRTGRIEHDRIEPESLGLTRARLEDIRVGTLDEAADLIRAIVSGKDAGPATDVVALNAACALLVADAVADLSEGLESAREAIRTGAAKRTLESLARVSRES